MLWAAVFGFFKARGNGPWYTFVYGCGGSWTNIMDKRYKLCTVHMSAYCMFQMGSFSTVYDQWRYKLATQGLLFTNLIVTHAVWPLSGDQLVVRQVGTPDTHQYTIGSITRRIVPRLRQLGAEPPAGEVQFKSQFNPREICGRQSDTETSFAPSTWVFCCHYHSTSPPYSFTYHQHDIIL